MDINKNKIKEANNEHNNNTSNNNNGDNNVNYHRKVGDIVNTVKLKVNKVYKPYLLDYKHRYEVYYGGASSGKSFFIVQKLILKALQSERRVLCIRNVFKDIRGSTFKLITDILKQMDIYKHCKINNTLLEITLPNGSVFLSYGMSDKEQLKSIVGITDIFVEEASEITKDDYLQLNLRLRADKPNLQLIIAYNPVSKANWVYEFFHANGAPLDTFVLHTSYKDNKFLQEDIIRSIEQLILTDNFYYRVYALGEFASLDKLIYPNYSVEFFNHKDIEGVYIFGLDFGYANDESAFVCAKVDDNNKVIYIFDEFYEKEKTNDELAEMIKYKGFAKEIILTDTEPKSVEEMRRHGIYRIRSATKGKNSILPGIQLLQQYKLVVHPNCPNIKIEIENYAWSKDKNGNYINKPVDKFNHALDALRYAIQTVHKPNKLKTMSKSALGI